MAAFEYVGRKWSVPAQTAGERLAEIERRNGEITPQAVVDDARPEGSVLHSLFEWDDAKAAEQYRIGRASTFIRCIVVKPEPSDKVKTPVRMFVNQNPIDEGRPKQGSYINVHSALENPVSRQVVLNNARYEMRLFRKKYSQLSELSKIFAAIDEDLAKASGE